MPKYPTKNANYRILARQRSRFTHYYFYIRGPMAMRVASFLPFQTTYYLNGHSFIEQELNRAQIGFRKADNAFLAVDDVAALQAAADRLSPEIIRKRLDYWTLSLGPKFSAKEHTRLNLSRFYAITRIEYCRNFIFKRHFPIHKLFERSCELGLWRLSGDKIAAIFGTRANRRMFSDNQDGCRIASSRNAPERVEHCLTRMLPAPHQFVNRLHGFCPSRCDPSQLSCSIGEPAFPSRPALAKPRRAAEGIGRSRATRSHAQRAVAREHGEHRTFPEVSTVAHSRWSRIGRQRIHCEA